MANDHVLLDTSLLSHALLPSQQVPATRDALLDLARSNRPMSIGPATLLEWPRLLLRFTAAGRLPESTRDDIIAFTWLLVEHDESVDANTATAVREAWGLALRLGLTDTFDATGYTTARRLGAEFWTSDQRFANAARSAGLDGVSVFR